MTTRKGAAPAEGARRAETKSAPSQDASRESTTSAGPWRPGLKLLVSALVAFHITAVFWAPLAFACAGSPLTDGVFAVLRPYLDALYLNHGYSFFAPDVGPSRLVRYKIEFADGREPLVGVFPNLATEKPRLLYHRHFMLSEALSNRFAPPDPPPEPTPPPLTASVAERAFYGAVKDEFARSLAAWQQQRRQYEAMRDSIEQHLLARYGGSKVTLTRVEHIQARPLEVQHLRRQLDDPASYIDLPETTPRPASGQEPPR